MPFSLKFRSLTSTLVVFLLIYSWRRLCLLLRGLDVWNVMWHRRFSVACCFLIMLARLRAAMVVLSAWKTCRQQPPCPPSHPQTWLWASRTPPHLYARVLQRRSQPPLFLPPAPRIPAAPGDWMVGEFGSSSADWWMACPTLSGQDGHGAGCGPQIVTFDGFIRVWLVELSSSWNEVPRHSSQLRLLPPRDYGSPLRSNDSITKPNWGQTGYQTGPTRLTLDISVCCEVRWRPEETCKCRCQPVSVFRVPFERAVFELAAEFLPYSGFDEPLESRSRGQVNRASFKLGCLLSHKAAFMQPSGGEVMQCVSAQLKCAAGINFNLILWL